MAVNYSQHLTEAWHFTWKYKVLWIFGFIAALFKSGSGSGNLNFSSNDSGWQYESGSVNNQVSSFEQPNGFFDWLSDPQNLILIIAIGAAIVLVWTLITWYLRRVSLIAILNANLYDERGESEQIGFMSLWGSTNKYLLRVLGMDFLFFLMFIVTILIMLVPTFFIIKFAIEALPLLCCLLPFVFIIFLIFAILIGLWHGNSFRILIAEDRGTFAAMSAGLSLTWRKIWQLLLAGLIAFAVVLPVGIVMFVISLTVMIPVFLLALPMLESDSSVWQGVILLVVAGIGLAVLNSIINAPVTVFVETYWNRLVLALRAEEIARAK